MHALACGVCAVSSAGLACFANVILARHKHAHATHDRPLHAPWLRLRSEQRQATERSHAVRVRRQTEFSLCQCPVLFCLVRCRLHRPHYTQRINKIEITFLLHCPVAPAVTHSTGTAPGAVECKFDSVTLLCCQFRRCARRRSVDRQHIVTRHCWPVPLNIRTVRHRVTRSAHRQCHSLLCIVVDHTN